MRGALRSRWLLLLPALAAVGACEPSEGAGGPESVAMVDDEFAPATVRVPLGADVTWVHQGTNPHNVTAADGSWRSEEVLSAGDTHRRTFDIPGAFPYFCTFHGTADGKGMAGWVLVGDDAEVPPAGSAAGQRAAPTGTVRTVPADHETIQEAVDAADPGDLLLIQPGIYREAVQVTTPFLTIRGLDRNATILDGGFELIHGIQVVEADGVAIENLTARNYTVNGFYWTGVTGYRGSYLTAHNNGDYGIYAFDSVDGLIEDSYASGNVDSGFYIGQCYPCRAVVKRVISEGNGIAYSGTNAGGDLYLIESVWRDNMGGIVPNSLDSELNPPHRETTIVANLVIDNNNREAPTKGLARLAYGNGIVLAGGVGDVVERNLVLNHDRFGIVAAPLPDRAIHWSQDAVVRENRVAGSGLADLALVGPWAPGNCFEDNEAFTTWPLLLQQFHRCRGLRLPLQADLAGLALLLGAFADGEHGFPTGSDYRTYPLPPPQPVMPAAGSAPAQPAVDVFQRPDLAGLQIPNVSTPLRAREVTMSGVPVSQPTFWTFYFSVYAYFLPLVLFSAWAALAIWDLARRQVSKRLAITWLAVILLVPFLGVVGYHLFGRSQIPAWFRGVVVGGGITAYLVILAIGALLGGLA